jgi:CoA:oxalate CoA-transferase
VIAEAASPLSGLRVLDFSQGVSGPFATKLLGAMGADVIKVEPPGAGDRARGQPPFFGDDPHLEKSGLFLYLNTNKRGVTLEIQEVAGRAIARRLVEWADVVIEDYPPDQLDEWGLGYTAVEQINPRAILVSVTGFGQDGPYRDYESSDLVTLALGGLLYITGDPEREPLRIGGRPSEYITGLAAFSATLIALHHRGSIGEGQHVDVSALETIAMAQMYGGLNSAYLHENRQRVNAFAPMFPVQDGYVGVMYRQQNWAEFCEMIGHPELVHDERFNDQGGRREHAHELNAIVSGWMAQQEKAPLYHRAQARRMPFGYICDASDLLVSPQYQERGYFIDIDHPVVGLLKYPGMPIRWGNKQWAIARAPLLGEHNAEVYSGMLGYSADELVLLRSARVI